MADWERNTPWRQGHLLSADTAETLEIVPPESREVPAVVVISHDCDLAQSPETEPGVEVIVGRFVEKPDGNYTHAKNLRRLHLRYEIGKDSAVVEILATDKRILRKEGKLGLAGHHPASEFRLGPAEHSILQLWLSARYRRAAFPDEFDRRFSEATSLRTQFTKILKTHGVHIPAVFFDVDDGEEVNRSGPEDTYTLSVYLLYSTQSDPEVAERDALTAKQAIESAFRERCQVGEGRWNWIELRECEVLADTAMTYAQSISLKKWQADYISLRGDPPQEVLQE